MKRDEKSGMTPPPPASSVPGKPTPPRHCSTSKKKIHSALSKKLSYILRHGALEQGLTVSSDGYVNLASILELKSFRQASLPLIQEVVRNCRKQRFSLRKRPRPRRSSFSAAQKCVSGEEGIDNYNYNNDSKNSSDDEKDDYDGRRGHDNDRQAELKYWEIRANQGHTMRGVIQDARLLKRVQDPSECQDCVHGTSRIAWSKYISCQGLSRMTRNHIHMALKPPGPGGGVISGARETSQVS